MNTPDRTDSLRWRFLVLAALILGTLGVSEAAGGTGTCLTAELDEPFRLPDGSWHPAGQVRICLSRTYSPVADLHTISTDSGEGGYFLGRHARSEQPPNEAGPEFLFERRDDQPLTLLAYRVPGRDRTTVYWLEAPGTPRRGPLPTDRSESSAGLELIAVVPARGNDIR